MIVLATGDGFTLADKENFRDFHVEAGELDHDEFAAAVRSSADVAPHEKPGHLWVSTDLLHRELHTSAHPDRRSALAKMLAYAGSKGWLNEAGTHVAAHIVVPE